VVERKDDKGTVTETFSEIEAPSRGDKLVFQPRVLQASQPH
jgi:hypothetical protein